MSFFYINPLALGTAIFSGNVTINGNLIVNGTTTLVGATDTGQIIVDITNVEALLVRLNADAGDVFNVDTTNQSVEIRDADLVFETGRAVTATRYSVGRDADATNQLHLNVPASASFEFSVNDIAQVTLNTLALNPSDDELTLGDATHRWSDLFLSSGAVINFDAGDVTITHSSNTLALAGAASGYSFDASLNSSDAVATTLTLQNQTFTAGATHNAVTISPTWAAENQIHRALIIGATQNGANTLSLVGFNVSLTKATGATTLALLTGGFFNTPTVTGTVTANEAIRIADQSLSGGTTSYGINILSQTANATTTRAIEIAGTGVNNGIRLGASPTIYSSAADIVNVADSTNARMLRFQLSAGGSQDIRAIGFAGEAVTLAIQTYTMTPGGVFNAFENSPGFTAENFRHTASFIGPVQSGANSQQLQGLSILLTKETGATTLDTMQSILIQTPAVTGTVTSVYGLDIAQQSPTGGTTSYGIRIQSQTANATTTRAIEIVGTGVNNGIRFGASPNIYSDAANSIRLMDSTDARGINIGLTSGGNQTIGTTTGNLEIAVAGTSELTLTSSALSPTTSDSNALGTSSLMWSDLFLASGAVINFNASNYTITHAANALTLTQAAATSGSPVMLTLTAGAHTTLTASTEASDIVMGARTVQFATGALALQRSIIINPPTYGFVGASTLTEAATVYIIGGPAAGTNATITLAEALGIASYAASATAFNAGATIGLPGLASGVGNVTTNVALALGSGTVSVGDQTATLTNASALRIVQTTFTSTTNTRTITNPAAFYIAGEPLAGTNVTFTNVAYSVFIDSGYSRFDGRIIGNQGADVASASNITLSDGNIFEITGTTAIDRISSTGWQDGAVVTLVFNESVTVNHATATSGNNITILLSGAANFSATANDTLTLVLCSTTANGQAWREVARTVI